MKLLFLSLLRDLRDTLAGGPKLFRLAPLIPVLAILPELVQHYVEIDIGMFASKAAFKAHAMDPSRWTAGYFKIAGYVAAIIGAAFYWGSRRRPRWSFSVRQLQHLGLAIAANVAFLALLYPLENHLETLPVQIAYWTLSILGLPLIIYFLAAVFDDATMTLRRAFAIGWLRLISILLCAGLAVVFGQFIHKLNHTFALGAPTPLVWALVLWDGIWVGLMACWIGTGIAVGYGRETGLLTKS